jgi:hypothetical protein
MSVYGINKLFRTCLHDKDFRALAKSDPEAAMTKMPLSEAEKDMLRRGDVAALYEHGAHAFLLSFLTRWELFGVTVEQYSERIHQAKDWRKAG